MINAIVDLIQSSAILVWAILTILWARRLDRRIDGQSIYRSSEVQDPQPICGCGHHQCFHDETVCAKVDIVSHWSYSQEHERTMVPCGCKRYTGPEQLPQVIP